LGLFQIQTNTYWRYTDKGFKARVNNILEEIVQGCSMKEQKRMDPRMAEQTEVKLVNILITWS